MIDLEKIFEDPQIINHVNSMIGCVVSMREHLRMLQGHSTYASTYAEYVEFCVKMGIETKHITEFIK